MTDARLQGLKDRFRGVSLGILAADLARLQDAAIVAQGWGAEILHFDVMDGEFVPALTCGPGFVKALGLGMLRDVHLMVAHPARHIDSFANAGADLIVVHAEAPDAAEALAGVRTASARLDRPIMAGLALLPTTTLHEAEPLLALNPDLVLLVALDPRRAKSLDIAGTCAKLSALRARGGGAILAFDGGVTASSIAEVAACGPDMVVSGSAVFAAADPVAAFAGINAALARG